MRSSSRSADASMVASSSCFISDVHTTSFLPQAGHGRLDAGEWRAEVVTDRRQQCRSQPVDLRELAALGRRVRQLLVLPGPRGGGGQAGEHPPVLAEAARGPRRQGAGPGRRRRALRARRAVAVRPLSTSSSLSPWRSSSATDVMPKTVRTCCQDGGQRGIAHRGTGERGQHLGLDPAALGGDALSRSELHGDAHRGSDHDEDRQGDELVALVDDEGVVGRGEEPVGEQKRGERGQQRGQVPPISATAKTRRR